jgi:DNA-directed RNA polymerase specialized sigma24 family protein
VEFPVNIKSPELGPEKSAILGEQLERYEAALARLSADDQAAIICYVELGFSYEELAVVLNKKTADAARMAVQRARKRLADELERGE